MKLFSLFHQLQILMINISKYYPWIGFGCRHSQWNSWKVEQPVSNTIKRRYGIRWCHTSWPVPMHRRCFWRCVNKQWIGRSLEPHSTAVAAASRWLETMWIYWKQSRQSSVRVQAVLSMFLLFKCTSVFKYLFSILLIVVVIWKKEQRHSELLMNTFVWLLLKNR